MPSSASNAHPASAPVVAAVSSWEQNFRIELSKEPKHDHDKKKMASTELSTELSIRESHTKYFTLEDDDEEAADSQNIVRVPKPLQCVSIGWEQNFRLEFQKQSIQDQVHEALNWGSIAKVAKKDRALHVDAQQLHLSETSLSESVETLRPPDSARENKSAIGCLCRLSCFETRPKVQQISKAEAPPPPPKAKAKARGPAPPPKAKARPPARMNRQNSAPPGPSAWKPTEGMKSMRTVNWTPIRQEGLLEGSVWQRVNKQIEKRESLDEGQVVQKEAMNKAFMCSVAKAKAKSNRATAKAKSRASDAKGRKSDVDKNFKRVLQPKQAFMADVLHCQLAKRGLADLERLCKVVGVHPGSSIPRASSAVDLERLGSNTSIDDVSSSSSDSDSDSGSAESSDSDSGSSSTGEQEAKHKEKLPSDEEALQTLMNFLQLADGKEVELKALPGVGEAEASLAPSEHLLQQLVIRGGPAWLLRSRVQAKLTFSCFPKQADELEEIIRSGMQAVRVVVNSTVIPVLLEGTLVLGNYVNSSSQALGSANGVTLESIARLAHTRALSEPADNAGVRRRSGSKEPPSAFDLLVSELRESQGPTWLCTLISELEQCRELCDVEATISLSMKDLVTKVKDVEKCYYPFDGCPEPPTSAQVCFRRFMAYATSRLATLRSLQEELASAITDMRKYFAEPPTTTLSAMMRSFSSLLDVLPRGDSNRSQPCRAPSASSETANCKAHGKI
mmetsp:Transcript_45186/g.81703  ORF Transcript_45186/g.81703 Transcript_45186/m.81703 type:complete len:732 (-) Transcript_45186:48-2243(-)